jgi:hypothetical protein
VISDDERQAPTSADVPDHDTEEHGHERAHLTMQTVDRVASGKVARFVQLADIRAVTLSAMVSPHYGLTHVVPDTWTEHTVIGYDTHTVEEEGEDPSRLRVMAVFYAHFDREWEEVDPADITEPPEDRPPDVEIEARFILEYELDDEADLTEDELRHFGYFNGTFNAWPYWREYAQEASARLGLAPRLIVPVFRVPRV